MNEFQFNLVKLFLGTFRIPAKRLAREWSIPLEEVERVEFAINFDLYQKIGW
jgi:hypothetical protein